MNYTTIFVEILMYKTEYPQTKTRHENREPGILTKEPEPYRTYYLGGEPSGMATP